MALYKLLLPKMGESVAEATIIKWNKAVGDRVEMDDPVIEIATDKVDSEVPSPVSGKLMHQLYKENEVVQVGSVIAIIEIDETDQNLAQIPFEIEENNHEEETLTNEVVADTIPGIEQLEQQIAPPVLQTSTNIRFYSPLVKSIASQEGVSLQELETIPGTGIEGRLTKDDLLLYIKNRKSPFDKEPLNTQPSERTFQEQFTPNQAVNQVQGSQESVVQPERTASVSGADEIIEMDRMRRLIADHMVASVQTSPHVTSFVEADVTNMVLWREKIKTSFEKREGNKITFTPIFIEAVARAIKDFPMINISVNGTQIIKKKDINIGMAAALPSGNLIVPVIRKADELNLVGLTKAVNDLANRARNNKLQPDEVKDGTFTITNIGSFGNIMGTPIINQPQVAILAVGAIKKKPAVIETETGDVIAIRHMMFLSLSYDHRVVDGALGGSLVRRIADYLEGWDLNREA